MATKRKAGGPSKRYRNSGVSTLVIEGVDINPGDEFNASLEPEYEMQMFVGGHLELLEDQSDAADQAQAANAEATAVVSGAADDATDSAGSNKRGRRS